jgi:putative transposase
MHMTMVECEQDAAERREQAAGDEDQRHTAMDINGGLRDACLNDHLFTDLIEAGQNIEEMEDRLKTNRPHSSLNLLTPTELAARPNKGRNWNRLFL